MTWLLSVTVASMTAMTVAYHWVNHPSKQSESILIFTTCLTIPVSKSWPSILIYWPDHRQIPPHESLHQHGTRAPWDNNYNLTFYHVNNHSTDKWLVIFNLLFCNWRAPFCICISIMFFIILCKRFFSYMKVVWIYMYVHICVNMYIHMPVCVFRTANNGFTISYQRAAIYNNT